MRLAVAVQRYGADINGGAELHARYIAERLSRHASVEVVTTCARDYVTWKNELPAGVEQVNGVTVRRFPVAHERNVDDFGRRSVEVFDKPHSLNLERHPNEHLAFGGSGPHFCMGSQLARVEIRHMLTEILTRMPDIEPAGPLEYLASSFISGPKHQPVRFTPGPRSAA